jgi:hypothetical protein
MKGRPSMFIRLPLSGELVSTLREHVERGARLLELLGELVEVGEAAGAALGRDVDRARRAIRRRKKR